MAFLTLLSSSTQRSSSCRTCSNLQCYTYSKIPYSLLWLVCLYSIILVGKAQSQTVTTEAIIVNDILPLYSMTMVRGHKIHGENEGQQQQQQKPLTVLNSLDYYQQSNDNGDIDNSNNNIPQRYIEIYPDESQFIVKFDFHCSPAAISDNYDDNDNNNNGESTFTSSSILTEIILTVNSLGAHHQNQVRCFKIYNYEMHQWEIIGDNNKQPPSNHNNENNENNDGDDASSSLIWYEQQFHIQSTRMQEYFNPNNRFISIRYESNNNFASAKLDFFQLIAIQQIQVQQQQQQQQQAQGSTIFRGSVTPLLDTTLQAISVHEHSTIQTLSQQQGQRENDDNTKEDKPINVPIDNLDIREGMQLGNQPPSVLDDTYINSDNSDIIDNNEYLEFKPEPDRFVVDFEYIVLPKEHGDDILSNGNGSSNNNINAGDTAGSNNDEDINDNDNIDGDDDIQEDEVNSISVFCHSKGPSIDFQERTLKIFNEKTSTWDVLGNNMDARHSEWTEQTFQIIQNIGNYLSSENPVSTSAIVEENNNNNNRSMRRLGQPQQQLRTPPSQQLPKKRRRRRLNDLLGSSIKLRFESNTNYDVFELDSLSVTLFVTSPSQSFTVYDVKNEEDLPPIDLDVAIQNPLKGFMTSSRWVAHSNQITTLPSSMDYYYIGLDTTMIGRNTFDWSFVHSILDEAASWNKHVVLRFFLDYPRRNHGDGMAVPTYLIDEGLEMTEYSNTRNSGGFSPDYSDTNLLEALHDFIVAFGEELDGDQRIGFIQMGLLGFWADWHTHTGEPETEHWIPESTKQAVADWYRAAFVKTPLQGPRAEPVLVKGRFGLHASMFAETTLSNTIGWYFWPRVESAGYTDFWQHGVMGGDLGPQEIIFSDGYPARNHDREQDFQECVRITHATYVVNNYAYETGYDDPNELNRALDAAKQMGYNFRVKQVSAAAAIIADEESSTISSVSIEATIEQIGIAPFYYPLSLKLSCGNSRSWEIPGVESIIQKGDMKTFTFRNIPATQSCLNNLVISLVSPQAYEGNPVKFAQGNDGRVHVSFDLPSTPLH